MTVRLGVHPWFMAGMGKMDHLIETCPAMNREGKPRRGLGCLEDIEDRTVCGWCRRVWKARNR